MAATASKRLSEHMVCTGMYVLPVNGVHYLKFLILIYLITVVCLFYIRALLVVKHG